MVIEGSWLKYISERIGSRGALLGVDRNPVGLKLPSCKILQKDVLVWNPPSALEGCFDVLTSDMAPNASGIRGMDQDGSHELNLRTLELSSFFLKERGSVVMKVFNGALFGDLIQLSKRMFDRVSIFKPKACRKESSEIYVISQHRKLLYKDAVKESQT